VAGLIVHRRVLDQRLEAFRRVRVAVLLLPGDADGELVEAQHIQHADPRDRGAEEIGPLGQTRADEQAAVAAPHNRELRCRRVLLGDQILRRGDEVVEHVLLVRQPARVIPRPPVLATAAQIRHGIDAAPLQPGNGPWRERRRQRDLEPAVAGEQRGVAAVLRESLLERQAHRDTRTVLRGVEDLPRLVLLRRKRHL
jgi:hypothetical protein